MIYRAQRTVSDQQYKKFSEEILNRIASKLVFSIQTNIEKYLSLIIFAIRITKIERISIYAVRYDYSYFEICHIIEFY